MNFKLIKKYRNIDNFSKDRVHENIVHRMQVEVWDRARRLRVEILLC